VVAPHEELWPLADERRARFDAAALSYDTYRPGYPEQSFDDLMDWAGLEPGHHVIEIGSGTGIATLPLLRRGLRVTCLEPAPAMAAVAQAKLASFTDVAHRPLRLEDWEPEPGSARAVVAANAWHWVNPEVAFPKVATALEDGGSLCLLVHHVVGIGAEGFADDLRRVRDGIAPPSDAMLRQGAFMEEHRWSEDMEASDLFTHLITTRHGFTRQLSAAEFVAVSNGGAVAKHEEAVLYVGRRRTD
jgi:SAM-dependent methyltransferase